MLSPDAFPAATPAILGEITSGLAAGRDLRELLDSFLEPIVRLAGARAGAARMLSPDGGHFELVSSIGLPAAVVEAERRVDHGCGFCGQGASQQRVVWATELAGCAARTHGEFFDHECHGAVAVPLQHKNRVLGIYNLFYDQGQKPPPAVLGLLRSIGELLGLALENLRLEAENLRASLAQERQAMAAEIHDAVAQDLTFIKMRLPLLRDAIEANEQESALAYLEDVRETLGQAHGSLREIVTHFRARIDPRGLARALDVLTARFCVRTGIELHVNNRMPQLHLPEQAEAELFQIVHEALSNIERHSGARHSWLSVEPSLAGLEVRVEDDGVGPVAAAGADGAQAHHGLDIMRERAQRLGADLSVGPRAGGGTVVRCAMPLPQRAGAMS